MSALLGLLGYIGVILIVAVVLAVAVILVVEFGYDVRDELAEKRAAVDGIDTFIDDWITEIEDVDQAESELPDFRKTYTEGHTA